MSLRQIFFLSLALSIDAATSRLACAAELAQVPLHQQQLDAMGVSFAALKPSVGIPAALSLPARVVVPPAQVRVLSAPTTGLIEVLSVATQQTVRAGETVGSLSAPGLLEAQRALIQAVSQQGLADATRVRDESLLADGIIALSRVNASRAQATEASAVRREREQALLLLGLTPDTIQRILRGETVPPRLALTAPGSGTITEVMVSAGQRVETGAPLLKVARLDHLWLELQVPAARVPEYRVGDTLEVDGRGVQARIINVGKSAQAESQVVELRAELAANASLLPGETVAVRVRRAADASGRWRLPPGALITGAKGPQVYVRTAHGVRPVSVVREEETPEGPAVRAALQSGDLVAVRGVAALRAAENARREER